MTAENCRGSASAGAARPRFNEAAADDRGKLVEFMSTMNYQIFELQ